MSHPVLAGRRVQQSNRIPLLVGGRDPHVKTARLLREDEAPVAEPRQSGRVGQPAASFAATHRHSPRVPGKLRGDAGVHDPRVIG